MNRKDLAKQIAENSNLSYRQAENLAIAFGAVVGDALSKGDKVVYSNFGTFYTVHYPSKIILHPKLGDAKKIVMLPTNAVKWMPSENIKDLVKNEKIVENATLHGTKRNNLSSAHNELSAPNPAAAQEDHDESEEQISIPITKISTKKSEISNSLEQTKDEEKDKPVNIYEELMKDGSKEEATFGDAIRVHKNKARSLFGRIFKKEESLASLDPSAAPGGREDKVSLVNSGVFQKESSSIPTSSGASKIDTIKATIQNSTPVALKPKVDLDDKEAEITPFSKSKEDISYLDLTKTVVPKEILQLISEKVARKYKAVPVESNDRGIVVAMVDPEDLEAKELLKKQTQKTIIPRLASEEGINFVLDQYNGLESEVEEAIETADKESTAQKREENKENLVETVSDNAPASRIVTSLLRRAIRDKASDIHIEPSENEVEVRFRIDGILKKKVSLPLNIEPAVVSRIKILSNLKIDEQRLPQDGRFSINFDNRKIDFRVSTMPVANGEKIVMRVLDKMTGILKIEELGIRGSGLEILKSNLEKSHGMTLVTGPTGSGKTTTLYALIDKLYSEGVNIVTLEDPIEYRMPGINQSQVNAEIDYTFASGLRSIVRQDPDIIMIGEIRDKETAEMAVHAALTGHIVLSTLHTNDATGAAPRLIDMGVEPFLLTSALNIVVGQRLARNICPDCKEEIAIAEAGKKKIQEEIEKLPEKEKAEAKSKELKFFHGKGCKSCNNTGYKGRIGLYEIFEMTDEIKDLILNKKSSSVIRDAAINKGMVTMLQDGILKALDGITSIEEVWRVTKD